MRRLALCLALFLLPSLVLATLPTVRGTGGVSGSSNPIAELSFPSGATTNDVCFAMVETADQTVVVGNTGGSETWTEVSASPVSITSDTRLTVYWARVSGPTPTGPNVTDSGNHQIARMICVIGAETSGDPWDIIPTGSEAVSDTTGDLVGGTTTVADVLVLGLAAMDLPDSNDTTSFSGESNGDLGSLTEEIDNCRNAGNGGCVYLVSGTKASAGTFGATTFTLEDPAQKVYMTIGVIEPSGAPPSRSRVVDVTG